MRHFNTQSMSGENPVGKSNDEKGAAGALIILFLLIAAAIWISFKAAKLVYQYSRSTLLAIWTFFVVIFLCLVTWFIIQDDFALNTPVVLLYLCGILPIWFATSQLYKLKKARIDELIEQENSVEKSASSGRSSAQRILFSAGAAYVGYKAGKSIGL